LEQSLNCLAPFGRLVIYGAASGETSSLNPQRLLPFNQSIHGFYLGNYFSSHPELIQSYLQELIKAIVGDRLRLHIGVVLPLAKAAEAHRLLETRQTTGKVILKP
jgi:NADPH2:quinone reductase